MQNESSVLTTFFVYPSKAWLDFTSQKSQESCAVCNLPIKGDSIVSNTKAFHPECMKCYICGEELRGTYFTFQDQPICEKDYKVRQSLQGYAIIGAKSHSSMIVCKTGLVGSIARSEQ